MSPLIIKTPKHLSWRKGLGGFSVFFSFFMAVGIPIQLYNARRAASEWPVANGVVSQRSVDKQWTDTGGSSSMMYALVETFDASLKGEAIVCRWQDDTSTYFQSWMNSRRERREDLWPVGSRVTLLVNPMQQNECMPEDNWVMYSREDWLRWIYSTALLFLLGAFLLYWDRRLKASPATV